MHEVTVFGWSRPASPEAVEVVMIEGEAWLVTRPGSHWETYDPMADPALPLKFADCAPTDAGLLAFARRFGGLGVTEPWLVAAAGPFTGGERLTVWRQHLVAIQDVVTLWRALTEGRTRQLREWIQVSPTMVVLRLPWPEGRRRPVGLSPWRLTHTVVTPDDPRWAALPRGRDVRVFARLALQDLVNAALTGVDRHRSRGDELVGTTPRPLVTPRLLYHPPDDTLQLHLVPRSLLGCLWLQVAAIVGNRSTYARCAHCGTWFAKGVDGKRRDARFCSVNCRVYASPARRRQRGLTRRDDGSTTRIR